MSMMNMRFAWIVAVIAMFGSLYFSEIRHFIPCEFCWYQRILMYPIAILLSVSLWRGEKVILPYLLPLSSMGILVSATHYLKQKIPAFNSFVPCTSGGVPCNAQYIDWLGFITIPFLAFIAFTLITITLFIELKKEKRNG